ncbi:unnamed protein product, partial [Mesorhabditis spiculigera]
MSRVYDSEEKVRHRKSAGPLRTALNAVDDYFQRNYVGQSDSADFTAAWKEKFSHAPTWCDADMSLQQIRRGKAHGNRIALYSRTFFQRNLFKMGDFIQRWPWTIAIISLILYTACCAGLKNVIIEVDIVKLWVPQGGRLDEEMHYLSRVHQQIARTKRDAGMMPPPIIPAAVGHGPGNGTKMKKKPGPPKIAKPEGYAGPELPKENGLGGGFQVVIQTPEVDGQNALNQAGLLKHVTLMEEIAAYKVELYGQNWTLADICFKPPQPELPANPVAKILGKVLDQMIPCIWITPIDCYWEGSKPLGPDPPINLGNAVSSFIQSLPKGNVTWKNLNPSKVMGEVTTLIDLGPVGNFFERAGIGAAYLDRPCINPLDPDCPATAPNYFDRCSALKRFNEWNKDKTVVLATEAIPVEEDAEDAASENLLAGIFGKKRKKRAATATTKKPQTPSQDYYDYENDDDYSANISTMLVTYSSICGLGVTTWLGINFNAATTQIVPFLSLGLGIDDMFLLLHNYDEIINTVRKDEMGVLLKETGLSVMVTSLNNILAFFAGTVLPVPALRSFCLQTAILLVFNLLSLVIIFPAFISLDLKRLRKGKRDLGYCFPPTEDPAAIAALDKENRQAECIVTGLTIAMTVFGLVGMYNSTLGLELSDVLPEHTAPAAFMRAREKYFSFYPMFAVLKGGNVDIPNQQEQIEEFRRRLGETAFMVLKDGKNAQPYWMGLMRTWLESLDVALAKDIADGVFSDLKTGAVAKGRKPSPESAIAKKLVCSFGAEYNCTGRLGTRKLVNNGIIQPDGFYNYLTAWFHVDNMMYYVSQASFAPSPPKWSMNDRPEPVPAARPLLHSQIPFYQTGLTDTPVIVEMIKEVRAVCLNYTENGLGAFPSGIAFTFWDQYLDLRWNLFLAICYIAFAVFVVISTLMFNPRAALMVMMIVVILTIQLGGFMGLFGVKMNGISAVTQICAVGIGVEFTAHVVLCFLTSLGTVNDRMESCLQHMFVPVFHGAISTFLGIVMLIFSQFDFVIKYFFVTMSVLVTLGIWNGLCVLPVLLTWFGPEPELTPADGGNRLPAPPPLAQQNASEKTGFDSELRNRKGDVEMTERAESASSSSASSSSDH